MTKREPEATPRTRAYLHLLSGLCTGGYRPGETIRIADVADELRLSGTPVREALCRLAGARLVDDRHREGFRMSQMTSDEVGAAYRLEEQLYAAMMADLRSPAAALSPSQGNTAGTDPLEPTIPSAFIMLRRRTGGSLARQVAVDLGRRLAPYRQCEEELLIGPLDDVEALNLAVRADDWVLARAMLAHYADRRAAVAARLHAAGSRPTT